MPSLNAATIHQNVDLMAVCEDFWDESFDRFLVGQVGDVDLGFVTQSFNGFLGGLIRFVSLYVRQSCLCYGVFSWFPHLDQ
jgi:hypothetical protein